MVLLTIKQPRFGRSAARSSTASEQIRLSVVLQRTEAAADIANGEFSMDSGHELAAGGERPDEM
jgi:hypothetical protein